MERAAPAGIPAAGAATAERPADDRLAKAFSGLGAWTENRFVRPAASIVSFAPRASFAASG
jgi:hypothetical protein